MKIVKNAAAMEAVNTMRAAEFEWRRVLPITVDLLRWLNAFSSFSD